METPIAEVNHNLNPVAGSSKSPRVITENLEEIKSSLRKEIMSDLTKILAENQKEMLKLIAAPVKKQTVIATTEETDSESENIPENATSTPIKSKTTATNRKITPVNSRNTFYRDMHRNGSQLEIIEDARIYSSIPDVTAYTFVKITSATFFKSRFLK